MILKEKVTSFLTKLSNFQQIIMIILIITELYQVTEKKQNIYITEFLQIRNIATLMEFQ